MNVNEGRLVHWLSYNRQESFAFRHLLFFFVFRLVIFSLFYFLIYNTHKICLDLDVDYA